jgi:hypothetical protein
MVKPFWRQKTFWAGAITIAASGAAYLTGDITLEPALQTSVTALIGIFIRQGMAKPK